MQRGIASVLLLAFMLGNASFAFAADGLFADGFDAAVYAHGSWEEVADSHMLDVCPPNPNPPGAAGNCHAVIQDWSGGVLDPDGNRLYLFGGGHNAYYGNEVYAFDIDMRMWIRVSDPTPVPADAHCPKLPGQAPDDTTCHCKKYASLDGGQNPSARHTYNQLAWITDRHELFLYGGAPACTSAHGVDDTWMFDPVMANWNRLLEHSSTAGGYLQLVYDASSKHVYLYEMHPYDYRGRLYSFDFASGQWTYLDADMNIPLDVLYRTGTWDAKRGQIWFVGNGKVAVLEVNPAGTSDLHEVKTNGATAIVDSESPGLAWDPVRDRIVAWCGGDNRCKDTTADQVYWLNPDTLTWYVDQPHDGPVRSQQRGTFGRWRYSPKSDVYIEANSVDKNVFFYHPPPQP